MRRILRTVQRAVHHVLAFRAILAANVLHHANVAAFDDHFGGVVVTVQDSVQGANYCVRGELVGVVWRARQKDRRVLGAFGNEDDRMQLHAVAHRNHHFATNVVEAVVRRFKLRRRFVWQRWGLLLFVQR